MDGTHGVTMLTWALQNVTSKSEGRAHRSQWETYTLMLGAVQQSLQGGVGSG